MTVLCSNPIQDPSGQRVEAPLKPLSTGPVDPESPLNLSGEKRPPFRQLGTPEDPCGQDRFLRCWDGYTDGLNWCLIWCLHLKNWTGLVAELAGGWGDNLPIPMSDPQSYAITSSVHGAQRDPSIRGPHHQQGCPKPSSCFQKNLFC